MISHHDSHYEKSLQRDMELLREKTLRMAMLDEGGLRNAIKALMSRDRQLAYTVILRDRCVDELEIEMDRLCLEFLVRQQPVARHLRFVFATIKIIRELERIGDYAESIARQVLHIISIEPIPALDEIQSLSEVAISMFHDCVQAFLTNDVEWARRLMIKEDIADEMRNHINTRLIQYQEEGQLALEALAPLMTIARRLERTTDQAKNICEEVIYMSTGESVKHKAGDVFRILFVDNDNSSLSQMAEAIGRTHSTGQFVYSSAGLYPSKEINPEIYRFLTGKGISLEGYRTKDFETFLELMPVDVIVALNEQVRKRIPATIANCVVFEWELAEPAMEATAAEHTAAYERAFSDLTHQVRDLAQAIIGYDQFELGELERAE